MRRNDDTLFGRNFLVLKVFDIGKVVFVMLVGLVFELDRDDLRDTRFFHRDAEHGAGAHNGFFVMRDDDVLAHVREFAERVDEASDVLLVERGVDLVEKAERRGLYHVRREKAAKPQSSISRRPKGG